MKDKVYFNYFRRRPRIAVRGGELTTTWAEPNRRVRFEKQLLFASERTASGRGSGHGRFSFCGY